MTDSAYPKIAQLKTVAALRAGSTSSTLPIDEKNLSAAEGSPLARAESVRFLSTTRRKRPFLPFG